MKQAARHARYGVAVLPKSQAHRIDGQADAASKRITDALDTTSTEFGPGHE